MVKIDSEKIISLPGSKSVKETVGLPLDNYQKSLYLNLEENLGKENSFELRQFDKVILESILSNFVFHRFPIFTSKLEHL